MTDQKEGEITKGVVSSCSYEARKYGIRSAMSLSKAMALCPFLILKPVDMAYYSEVSRKVMAILENYADIVEQASIDEAFLDCSTKISLQETPEKYAMTIKQAIKEKLELLCSVGVAHTRSAAKIASDYKKPDGLIVIYPDDLKGFLAPLEVNSVSGIGPKTQHALKEMGILTLGQLAKADVQKLKERFGKNGQWMWKVANGADDDPVAPRGDHISLSTENTLDEFTRDKAKIVAFLQELVPELYDRAQKRGYMFRTVGVKLVRTDFSAETREISFDEFQTSPESISSQIEHLVSKFSFIDNNVDGSSNEPAAIRKVGLKVSNLARIVDHGAVAEQSSKAVQKRLLDYY
jgi:DNA polymerase IV (DinB-like DNA polymerase)